MKKTHQCMTIQTGAARLPLVCIHHLDDTVNPFWLYAEYWDGGKHRRLVAKYADRLSVLAHAMDYIRTGILYND